MVFLIRRPGNGTELQSSWLWFFGVYRKNIQRRFRLYPLVRLLGGLDGGEIKFSSGNAWIFFFLSRIYPLYVGAPNFLSLIFLWVACVEVGFLNVE